MKVKKELVSRQWRVSNSKLKKGLYINVGIPKVDNKGFEIRFGYGYVEELKKYNEHPINTIKNIIKNFPLSLTKEEAREKLNELFKNENVEEKEVKEKYHGLDLIENIFNYFDIFKNCKDSKSKSLKDVVIHQIYQKFKLPMSIYGTYKSIKKETATEHCKNSYYRSLDYLAQNQKTILKNLNQEISKISSRNIKVLWYDTTTSYFETFKRGNFRKPGFSKDGKFKEDQIVIGLITDENGIPLHYKVFPGNTADSSTFISFMLELEKFYGIKNVTIIADKGMSVNRNIRFLEDKGWNFIISYRMKVGSKAFKQFVTSDEGWIKGDEIKYKLEEIDSTFKGKRLNGHKRRKVVTFSQKRAQKDKKDRDVLINNFTKKMDKNGLVAYEDVIGGKKYRFFEPIEKGGFYKLNIDKIEEDEQFDGFYVYETNRNDLKIEEIVNLYSKQWQVEENFRTFKGTLMLRPVYLSTWNHIVGYICLSFITLVFLNFILNMINEKTGLTGKSKITEHKLKEMIFDVKSVNTFIHNHISTSVEIKNNANSSSWETYHLIKTVLMKEKILLF